MESTMTGSFYPLYPTLGPDSWNQPMYKRLLTTLVTSLMVGLIAAVVLASEAVALSLLSTRRCFPAANDWWWMYCGHVMGLVMVLLLLMAITRTGRGGYLKDCFFAEETHEPIPDIRVQS